MPADIKLIISSFLFSVQVIIWYVVFVTPPAPKGTEKATASQMALFFLMMFVPFIIGTVILKYV